MGIGSSETCFGFLDGTLRSYKSRHGQFQRRHYWSLEGALGFDGWKGLFGVTHPSNPFILSHSRGNGTSKPP